MSFNGPISKRSENVDSYPDWKEWLEGRLGEHVQQQDVIKEWRPEFGGRNFVFVCWGDVTDLKLWEPKP